MGTISGIPTIAVNSTPLTFTVTDSSKPTLTKSANLTLTVLPATLTITTSSLPNGHGRNVALHMVDRERQPPDRVVAQRLDRSGERYADSKRLSDCSHLQ